MASGNGKQSGKPGQFCAGIVVRQYFNKIASRYCHSIRSILAHPNPVPVAPCDDLDGVSLCGYSHRGRRQPQHLPKLDTSIPLAANYNGVNASARGVRLCFKPTCRISRQAAAGFFLKLRSRHLPCSMFKAKI